MPIPCLPEILWSHFNTRLPQKSKVDFSTLMRCNVQKKTQTFNPLPRFHRILFICLLKIYLSYKLVDPIQIHLMMATTIINAKLKKKSTFQENKIIYSFIFYYFKL